MTADMHSPTPEFRDRLEWEVATAFRRARRERALSDGRASRIRPRLRAAAALLVAVAIGASAGLASAQIADASRRDSLLDASMAELYLASLRLDLARAQLDDARRREQLGAADAAAVASADADFHAMQAKARRLQLNMEEIRASSTPQAPRDDLNAPLVGGRDFMLERLRLDLFVAQQRLTSAERALGDIERRVRVGAADPLARLEAEGDVARARASLAALAERQNLRREFLEKGTPIDELVRRQQRAELRSEAMVAQQALAIARERLSLLEKSRAAGAAGELDVLRARVAVGEREIELQRLMSRLRGGE